MQGIASQISGPVLGLETSCDETAAAVLAPDGHILAEAVLSQTDHAAFGGVVPEIAARAHLTHLPDLVRQVMAQAGIGFDALAGIGASSGPGLIGGLIVGSGFAKGVALARGIPFVAVEGVGQHRRLGGTIDDAVGEAFDKVGKLLGLGWPGGPAVERLAAEGDAKAYALPRPLLGRPGCDFSFSGLKTAVAQLIAGLPPGALQRQTAANIAASFQAAVADVIANRARNAIAMFRALHPNGNLLVVAGGVAANATLRTALQTVADQNGFTFAAPPLRLCTDNAVMVAWTVLERLRLGLVDGLDHAPRPRWPLESLAS